MATSKQTIISELRKQTDKGELADNVAIAYHLQGGVGDDRVDEMVAFSAPGSLRIEVEDRLGKKVQKKVSSTMSEKDCLSVCRSLLDGVDTMVSAENARFIPDTLIGSVTFSIGDEAETFYFEADEESCEHRGQPIPEEIKNILGEFNKIEAKHLHIDSHDRRTIQ